MRIVESPNCDERPPNTEITLVILHSISLPPGGARWWAAWSSLAALMALTRPDGLLFCAATGLLWAWQAATARRPLRLWAGHQSHHLIV